MTTTAVRYLIALVPLLSVGVAAAQEPRAALDDEPTPPARVAPTVVIPDAAYRALEHRSVLVRQRSGAELCGELLAHDASWITLATAPYRDIVVVAKADVVLLRLVEMPDPAGAAPSAAATAPAATATRAAPTRTRQFGLNLGLSPALDLDYESGLFYGFLNGSLVFPMATHGDWLAFAAGAGVSFPDSKSSAWRFEIFAHFTPLRLTNDWYLGLGVGIGLHYTFHSGFALGFKAPILGYAVTVSSNGNGGSAGQSVAMYYLGGAMGLPIISLGYRF